MRFNFQFANLLGCSYRAGNIVFTPTDDVLISPVGNRLTTFDLKNNKSQSLPIESRLNITTVALCPDGNLMLLVNEEGEAFMCSLRNRCIINRHHFHEPISSIKFSPDGSKFAVTKNTKVLIYLTPGREKVFNPFVLQRTLYGSYDTNISLDWTSDSRALCVGCRDMNTRVYAAERLSNLIVYSLGGHSAEVVGSFFEKDSLDLYTLAANGHLCVWECDTELSDLRPVVLEDSESESEEEDDDDDSGDKKDPTHPSALAAKAASKILYKKAAKHSYRDVRGADAPYAQVSAVAFHHSTHILLAAFTDGTFYLHELPEFNVIHSLNISDSAISSACFNTSGDWLALGCSTRGQLLVWEWASETFILKEQGHTNAMTTLAYSPDGHHMATGGDDSQVKIWNALSGRCIVTFSEHKAAVTGIAFPAKGNFFVSSSLDGTVRAFDMKRYRNFKTFTSAHPVQFSCVAVDDAGEVVSAGSVDTYEVFVWVIQSGRQLEVLAGHEGPISGVAFSPSSPVLASASWDKTIRLWDLYKTGGSKGTKESIFLNSEALGVAFRPDGKEVAVTTLKAHIICYNVETTAQTSFIECKHDLGYVRRDTDKVTAKKASSNKSFTTLCYSADGQHLLAGGQSKNVCIYSVADQMLLKQFEITCNMSLDGMQESLDRRKMTHWGSLALVDDHDAKISLPGVRKGDMSSRSWKPEVRVTSLAFSPTGRSWAATTTEGLLVYSLDEVITFDPYDLGEEVTPDQVRKKLSRGDYSVALVLAIRLNDKILVREVLERVDLKQAPLIIESLSTPIVNRLITFLAGLVQTSPHLQLYACWAKALLYGCGPAMKQRAGEIQPSLTLLQTALTQAMADLRRVCDYNKYMLAFLMAQGKAKRKRAHPDSEAGKSGQGIGVKKDVDQESDSDDDDDSMGLRSPSALLEDDSSEEEPLAMI